MLISRFKLLKNYLLQGGSVRSEGERGESRAVTMANRMWLVARQELRTSGLQGEIMTRTYTTILR
jgi:hypothetical protein